MKRLLQFSNVRTHWGIVYGLGCAFEWDAWYSPEAGTYRDCLTFKVYLLGLLVTGNLYVGGHRNIEP